MIGPSAIQSAAPAVAEVMSKDELKRLIDTRPVPFSIRVRHAIVDGAAIGCSACGSIVDCVQVATESERSTGRAAHHGTRSTATATSGPIPSGTGHCVGPSPTTTSPTTTASPSTGSNHRSSYVPATNCAPIGPSAAAL